MTMSIPHLTRSQQLGLGGALLLALGAAGGAGAISLTRPSIEMAPTVATPVSRLASASGIVTVRGRVAAVYGDRFLVQDGSGRALVDAGRGGTSALRPGSMIMVQGRYDNGQLRARFLVDSAGAVQEVGPPHPRIGHDGPPPPPRGGPGAPPPPLGRPGAPPPPPGNPGAPPAPAIGTTIPAPAMAPRAGDAPMPPTADQAPPQPKSGRPPNPAAPRG